MNKFFATICIFLYACTAIAQEGEAYRRQTIAHEKVYLVSQKHGKNILSLDTQNTILYDENGKIHPSGQPNL
ncbi:MAG: hypothetical protein WCQ59_01200 [Candidatus Cloacimonadaceae bacterium]